MHALASAAGLEATWRGFRRHGFPWESWHVEGGTLHVLPDSPAIDLATRDRYRDFALTLEWRLARGGNSGILYRVRESAGEAWQSGPEMQLLDDAHHPDGAVPETSCGALYELVAPSERLDIDPAARFHTARIAVREQFLEHWIDEHKVLSCDLASRAVRELIATSKFRACLQFASAREGHIVLQHHGSEAWFRNIRIRRL